MLSAKTNDVRNQIMQKFKYEQIKRRNLREFLRQAKADVIVQRGGPGARDDEKQAGAMLQEKAHQAKTAEEKDKVWKLKEEHKAKQLQSYTNDYVGYMSEQVIKDSNQQSVQQTESRGQTGSLHKLPSRKKNKENDTVEQIAESMQALIKFGRQQTKKLREVQTVAQ